MSLIPISGIPSSYRTPGSFAEVLFAQGPGTASAGLRSVLFVMPMTAAGTWTANTVYEVRSEATASTGGGIGSPIHRGIRAFLKRNKNSKVYALPYPATTGGSPVAAAATITYSVTATGLGSTVVTACGESISTKIAQGDLPATVATNVANNINSKEYLPFTASAASGVVTLTARVAGVSQGTGTVGVIRFRATVVGSIGTTVATSGSTLGSSVAGADGTTSEAQQLATALNAVRGSRNYFMVFSVNDSTSLANVVTHIGTKSAPNPGLRSVGIAAWTGTLASGITLSQARNYERLAFAWQLNSEHDHAELAAALAAARQQEEEKDAAFNFDGYRDPVVWQVLPAASTSDWPTLDDFNDAINGGLTPIGSDASGSYIVMSVTSRSKNAAGTVADFRAAETHRVSVADQVVDTLLVRFVQNYSNKKLASDRIGTDGKVDTNQRLGDNVVTPFYFKQWLTGQFDPFDTARGGGLLQDVAATKASLQVLRDPSNTGRLECSFDLRSVDLFHQATFRVAEVSPG